MTFRYSFVVVVVYFFNEDKVMDAYIRSIPAIDTWCIQLQALLPNKPVNEPALCHTLLGYSVRCSSPVCMCMSHVAIFIKVAHSGYLFQPRPVELVND